MATLIITVDGKFWRRVALDKDRLTIGRNSRNDVVIDHAAVSADHAVIVITDGDAFLEDLGSTNGTKVNGQPVKKHFLRHGDMIELASYALRFSSEDGGQVVTAAAHTLSPSVTPGSGDSPFTGSTSNMNEPGIEIGAIIRILNGVNKGKEIVLSKPLTTIGRPGEQVAAITRGAHGYSIARIEGDGFPLVNGRVIGEQAFVIEHQDVITLAGTQMIVLIN